MNPFPGPCSRMWPSWDWMQNSSAHSNPREVMLQYPPVAVLGGGGGVPLWLRGNRGCPGGGGEV